MSTQYKALKEITQWDDAGYKVLNHTYILNEHGHCVGFRSTGTKKYTEFKSPMKQFSKSRRKFIELKPASKYMRNG
jgi:hypothetical protein